MRRWPAANTALMREDAAAGLTLNQCALKRSWHPSTLGKHAKLNGVIFREAPRQDIGTTEDRRDLSWTAAKDQLWKEIVAAKAEAATAPLYRRWPDGV